MTKRIVGLVLALCLVVGLLPMATLAAETESVSVSIAFQSSTSSVEYNETKTLTPGMTAIYGKTDATTGVIAWEGDESDYNIKLECAADGVPTMTLQNAYINKAKSGGSEHNTSVSGTGDLLIKLIGENKIDMQLGLSESKTGYGLVFSNAGDTTFTSVNGGTLTMTHSQRTVINKTKGNLIFKDANVTINELAGAFASVVMYGATDTDTYDFIVDGGNVNINNSNGPIIAFQAKRDKYSGTHKTGDVIIKNGANVAMKRTSNGGGTSGRWAISHDANSKFTITDSTVSIYAGHTALKYAPYIYGCYEAQYSTAQSTDADKLSVWDFEPGHSFGEKSFYYFSVKPLAHSQALTYVPAKTSDCSAQGNTAYYYCEHGFYFADAEGKNSIEANSWLLPQGTHTPAADDNDCSTDTVCTVCGAVTTPAPGHTPEDRATCDVAANCEICGKEALAAGQHSGGKATCQAKAVCEICGEQYGDIGDHAGGTADCKTKPICTTCGEQYGDFGKHTPENDDGDCTTAAKCSVCQGVAIEAKTHTFTNSTDTTCDNEGCTHTRVISPKPAFKLGFATVDESGTVTNISASGATLTMNPGAPAKYYVTEAKDSNYYMKATTDTTNWNMKVEYPADGVPTVTLKDAKMIATGCGLMFGGRTTGNAYEGSVKLVLEGNNEISNGYNSDRVPLYFNIKGADSEAIITGSGKLTIATNTEGAPRGIIQSNGDLVLDNANITLLGGERYGTSHGISVIGGDLTVKGGNLRICAYDNPKATHDPDYTSKTENYRLNTHAMYSALYVTKTTGDNPTGGNVTVQDGANVYMAVSISVKKDPDARMVATDGKFTIKESTVEMGLVGQCIDTAKLFTEKPTLEYANNAYTVTAIKTKKPTVTLTDTPYDKYTKDVAMTPDFAKQVDWAETTSLGAITYFKVVPGGNGGNGTGTGTGSNPNTGDISILLTAAVSLSSAVGFAGITVLRKKKG